MKDLTDQEINGFKVTGLSHKTGNKTFWSVTCPCGKEREPMREDSLRKHSGKCTCKLGKGDCVNGYTLTGITRKVHSGVEREVIHCCGDVRYLKIADLRRLKSKSCPMCRNPYIVEGNTVIMDISTKTYLSTYTTFDLEDLPSVLKHKWYAIQYPNSHTHYVQCDSSGYKNELHRHIMCSEGYVVDHIDGNGLNNQKSNMRLTDCQGNSRNTRRHKTNTTGYMGTSETKVGKYIAYIIVDGKQVHLGYHDNLEDAVKVRKEAELFYGFHENHGRESIITD